jgi:hypothetical protein
MPSPRAWDVTICGRIEHVTDQDAFPDLFEAALAEDDEVSVVEFCPPTWPHTTSAVIRISAGRKEDAERKGREIMLRVLGNVAPKVIGDRAFGWALSADAVPAPQSNT